MDSFAAPYPFDPNEYLKTVPEGSLEDWNPADSRTCPFKLYGNDTNNARRNLLLALERRQESGGSDGYIRDILTNAACLSCSDEQSSAIDLFLYEINRDLKVEGYDKDTLKKILFGKGLPIIGSDASMRIADIIQTKIYQHNRHIESSLYRDLPLLMQWKERLRSVSRFFFGAGHRETRGYERVRFTVRDPPGAPFWFEAPFGLFQTSTFMRVD